MTSANLWGLILSNVALVVLAGVLTAFSILAYQREGNRIFVSAAFGFGLVSAGILIRTVYQLGVTNPYYLTGLELIQLQTIVNVVIAAGLLTLIYSLVQN